MTIAPCAEGFLLDRFLLPLAPYLAGQDITDIFINRPGEVWLESLHGGVRREDLPELTSVILDRIARQIAAYSNQGVSRAHPLLAATLPDGARVQIALPPATRGEISISIRKHLVPDFSLDDYESYGALPQRATSKLICADTQELVSCHQQGDFRTALKLAVNQRRNILISGGTSSGKTTFLNALLREIPGGERLVLIEDTPELFLRHQNAVGLIAVRGEQGEAQVGADDLLTASLRMRPDRIILGELRGIEAFTFLRAVNTGHPGSMTTIHADGPDRAMEQLALLVLQRGVGLRWADILDYVASVIDVFVHLERGPEGRRISEVRLADRLAEPGARCAIDSAHSPMARAART